MSADRPPIDAIQQDLNQMRQWVCVLHRHTRKGDGPEHGYGPWIVRFADRTSVAYPSDEVAEEVCRTLNQHLAGHYAPLIDDLRGELREVISSAGWFMDVDALDRVTALTEAVRRASRPPLRQQGPNMVTDPDWCLHFPCDGWGTDEASREAEAEAAAIMKALNAELASVRQSFAASIERRIHREYLA